jgi:hypothetical protein
VHRHQCIDFVPSVLGPSLCSALHTSRESPTMSVRNASSLAEDGRTEDAVEPESPIAIEEGDSIGSDSVRRSVAGVKAHTVSVSNYDDDDGEAAGGGGVVAAAAADGGGDDDDGGGGGGGDGGGANTPPRPLTPVDLGGSFGAATRLTSADATPKITDVLPPHQSIEAIMEAMHAEEQCVFKRKKRGEFVAISILLFYVGCVVLARLPCTLP